ncbi:diaminobutyrate--2-oxoglutarate transaminase [Massilia sp. Root335]|uniref:diaminobutyrate--2-oxoglutarate transaminase n=1 Tax=Massilia sp. Root335 TaxID=1736517 RepID=UPI0009E8B8AA|nr:diaminobutyrate--2-oxoglutarate transaminase [Massilia sp. Root335]
MTKRLTADRPDVYERHESNVRYYCRNLGLEFSHAKNATIFSSCGRTYIDMLSGCGSLNYGHNDPDMKAALVDYINSDGISLSLDFHSLAKTRFIGAFVSYILQPRGLEYKLQFTGPTGTNGVEAALKLARKATGRRNVIAFTNGFHGMSLGALGVTGNSFHRRAAGTSMADVSRVPYDGYFSDGASAAQFLDIVLADPSSGFDVPGAIILEIVQGEGGLNTASVEWLRRVREIADKYGAILIVDDIQAGCGRTGTFFSFEGTGVVPDIVVLAKSLSGFGIPMSAVLIRPELDIWAPGEHNGTFRGNNHAFVTGEVAIRKFWSDDSFEQAVFEKSRVLEMAIDDIALKVGGYSKGRGMMRGLGVPSPEIAKAIQEFSLRNGLILERCGPRDEVVKLMPPLTINMHVLKEAIGRFSDSCLSACKIN